MVLYLLAWRGLGSGHAQTPLPSLPGSTLLCLFRWRLLLPPGNIFVPLDPVREDVLSVSRRPAVPLHSLLSRVSIVTPWVRTWDGRRLVVVHHLSVLAEVTAVAVAVAAHFAPKRLLIRVGTHVGAQSGLDAESLVTAWMCAGVWSVLCMCRDVVGELLLRHAAMTALLAHEWFNCRCQQGVSF